MKLFVLQPEAAEKCVVKASCFHERNVGKSKAYDTFTHLCYVFNALPVKIIAKDKNQKLFMIINLACTLNHKL